MRLIDRTGQRFGRLLVLGRADNVGKKVAWLCECACGNTLSVISNSLSSGRSTSCGCARIDAVTAHGHSRSGKSPEYNSWQSMKARCNNPDSTGYNHYGGRGIAVCNRWDTSFAAFLEDMGPRPSILHTLDRIDPNGNYEPGNCRWATKRQQGNTRRSNRRHRYRGRVMTISEWCRFLNVPEYRVRSRLRSGWSFHDAVSTPPRKTASRKNISGQRFGKCVAVKYACTIGKRAYWTCNCDCGSEFTAMGKDLRQGRTVSCGCKSGKSRR